MTQMVQLLQNIYFLELLFGAAIQTFGRIFFQTLINYPMHFVSEPAF